jgi:hypothetical protein
MSHYKFAIVFSKINDYVRIPDLVAFEIKPEEFEYQVSIDKVAYIVEDVNRAKTDKVMSLLEQGGVKKEDMRVLSRAMHKEFDRLQRIDIPVVEEEYALEITATKIESMTSASL